MVISRKSWKWILAYEKARKLYGIKKARDVANRTIIKRIKK